MPISLENCLHDSLFGLYGINNAAPTVDTVYLQMRHKLSWIITQNDSDSICHGLFLSNDTVF
jgi:hypothetical protein